MSEIKSYIDESMVDLVIRSYGHIEGLITFSKDNGVALDDVETSAIERLVDDTLKAELVNNRALFPQKPIPKKARVFVNEGQNLIDLALQETGAVEGLISFLRGNDYAPNDDPLSGEEVQTLTLEIQNEDVWSFYRALKYVVNTGSEPAASPPIIIGIGVMIIEDTFIIG